MKNTQALLKKARISFVPEKWTISIVGDACSIRNDLRKPISIEERSSIQGVYPYYGPTGILDYINEFMVEGEFSLIGEDGDHFLKPDEKPQTILVQGKFNVNNHAHLIASSPTCYAHWFSMFFKHRKITDFLSRQGANRYKLNKATLEKLPILLPPLIEQQAIADLLSTWDEAIEKIERLIRAKEKRFKRFLNDLIFLPTVSGEWKEILTKSLFKERTESKRGDLPLLSITNGDGVIPRDETNRKDSSNEDKSKYLRICVGDIGYNTMRMWQGVSALSTLEGIVSPAYTVCITGEKLHPSFVAYLFKMPFMIHRFYRYSQGLTSDTWNLKYRNFCEVKMPIPSLDEQHQIAETLNAAQQEIDLLKQLLEKYKSQKSGLMQKLLTGVWRVKPEFINQYKEI